MKSTDGSRVICECDACADRKPGCNYRFEPVLYTSGKRKGEQRMKRDGVTPMRVKIQVCQRAKIEIELDDAIIAAKSPLKPKPIGRTCGGAS